MNKHFLPLGTLHKVLTRIRQGAENVMVIIGKLFLTEIPGNILGDSSTAQEKNVQT